MKTHLLFIFSFLLFPLIAHAQQGNTRSYPIEVALIILSLIIQIHKTRKILQTIIRGDLPMMFFYKFTISTRMKVIMKHCESELSDTYLSLLDASGKLIDYNDDADFSIGCGGGAGEAYLSKILDAGTYYVVAEGYEENGVITTQITGMFYLQKGIVSRMLLTPVLTTRVLTILIYRI